MLLPNCELARKVRMPWAVGHEPLVTASGVLWMRAPVAVAQETRVTGAE